MTRQPPMSTRTDTLFPYTTLSLSPRFPPGAARKSVSTLHTLDPGVRLRCTRPKHVIAPAVDLFLPFTRESQHPPRGPHQERGHPSGRRRSRADPANNLGICIEAEFEPAIIAWRDRREQFGVDHRRDQIDRKSTRLNSSH